MMSDEMDMDWGAYLDRVTGLEEYLRPCGNGQSEGGVDIETDEFMIDGELHKLTTSLGGKRLPRLTLPTPVGSTAIPMIMIPVSAIIVECDHHQASIGFDGIDSCRFAMEDKGQIYFNRLTVNKKKKRRLLARSYLRRKLGFDSNNGAGELAMSSRRRYFAGLSMQRTSPCGYFEFSVPKAQRKKAMAYHLELDIEDRDSPPDDTTLEISGWWEQPLGTVQEAVAIKTISRVNPLNQREADITVRVDNRLAQAGLARIRIFCLSSSKHIQVLAIPAKNQIYPMQVLLEDEEDYGFVRNGTPQGPKINPGTVSALIKTWRRW